MLDFKIIARDCANNLDSTSFMKIISFLVLVISDFLCSLSLFSQQTQNINLALLDGIKKIYY